MRIFRFLFTPFFMGVFFVVFAVILAVATFIENDFGSASAYGMVYNTRWFELIILLLAVNLTGQVIIYRLFRKEKLPVALFHLSFILMIAGAGITRYFGWEGSVHIREGEKTNSCLSESRYLSYTVTDKSDNIVSKGSTRYSMTTRSADNFKRRVSLNGKKYEILLARIIPNAEEVVADSPDGSPMVSLHISDSTGSRETLIIKKGELKNSHDLNFGFSAGEAADITISADSGSFMISSRYPISLMSMMSHESSQAEPGSRVKMRPMQILNIKGVTIVPQQMSFAGVSKSFAVDPSQQVTGRNAFIFHVFSGHNSYAVYLWDNESKPTSSGSCTFDDLKFEITYGSKSISLPFDLKLNDFVLERYPGSNSPSGYKSYVTLYDSKENVEKPFTIFMNNILKYKGYRFYQSSFDKDEKGTVLSVNHDMAGMLVTYTGYGLLFLFIVLSLFIKSSLFRNIKPSAWSSTLRKNAVVLVLMILISGFSAARAQELVPTKEGADCFGKVLVQDQKGRTKPLYTLSSDILRKVSRSSNLNGMTPMQVFLGLYFDFDHWKDVPMIRISNKDIQKKLSITGNMASFSNIVDLNSGSYRLGNDVNAAYEKSPSERNKYDKELMKVDERVNIIYMIYKGEFMKVFPLHDASHNWGTASDALKSALNREDSAYLSNIMPLILKAVQSDNPEKAKEIAESVSGYQQKYAGYTLASSSKTNAEVLYYRLAIFEKLFPFYATLGLVMIALLTIMVIRGLQRKSLVLKVLVWILIAGFLVHTFGLGLRWYIAGHSPMTNGYESLIFISWVTLLAGFVFSRKSAFSLPATAVLSGFILMVAHLSFMDPEITNLVPVLKSYWLTLHVSVITGSYGFLGFGAILGLINMILILLANQSNRERISATIDELTVINYQTLTLGLYFLTIGTFLGAVWANESWGRYWGWDPKETWSLITIIVYAFVTHSRMIPGMKSIYTFNLLSLAGFSSVLMTYFGVNYYLSGMHSYASGDPVPVPLFVYIAVAVLAALCVTAYLRYRKAGK